jgi:flavorubredoxin
VICYFKEVISSDSSIDVNLLKVIIVYESMFGNAKRAAELIVDGINETKKA